MTKDNLNQIIKPRNFGYFVRLYFVSCSLPVQVGCMQLGLVGSVHSPSLVHAIKRSLETDENLLYDNTKVHQFSLRFLAHFRMN